jgi:hypothetical protein
VDRRFKRRRMTMMALAVPPWLPLPNCIKFSLYWRKNLMQFALGVPDHRLWQADVRRQRRWLRGLKERWERLQGD